MDNKSGLTHVVHAFPPLFDSSCRILILGSVPSPKSRETGFYYGHPRNRFWKVLAAVFSDSVPDTVEEKKAFLLSHHVALYDTVYSCDIYGSSDSSIRNVVPADLSAILRNSRIERIFCNGRASGSFFEKYQEPLLGIKAVTLPSTSPANASWTLEKLIEAWKAIL